MLFSVCFTLFSDVTFICFLGVNIGWDASSLSARMLNLLHQFVPDFGNAIPAHLVKYSLSGIGRFDKILPCPHEDEQKERLSSASIKFLMRNIYEIIHIWTAGEDESVEWSSQWISNLSNPSYQISVAFRQIHDPSGISPALSNASSTLLSCCSQHFSCSRSRFLYTSSGGHAQWQRQ